MRASFRPGTPCVALVALLLAGCPGGQGGSIGAAFADADNDGWFDGANNLITVLTFTRLATSASSSGLFRVTVDDVRFPNGPGIPLDDGNPSNWFAFNAVGGGATLNLPVAKRVQGMNHYNQSLDPGRSVYASSVRVVELRGGGAIDYGTSTVNWSSDGGETRTLIVGGGANPTLTLTFTSATTRFSDPNPGNASGDSDGDGITESEEYALVSRTNGLGDPQPGGVDIVCVVGFTEPSAAMDPMTAELLRTRFFSRSINLHMDTGTLNGRPGFGGGPMTLGGTTVVPGTAISIDQTLAIRNENIPAASRRPTHFVLLAAGIDGGAFGWTKGSHSVMRASLGGLLGSNFWNYQAGIFMHELGHQLTLCHPTEQTGAPNADGVSCPAIPVAERNPAASVMGSPAETRGFPLLTALNTLLRPLDFTPGQWLLVNPGAALTP